MITLEPIDSRYQMQPLPQPTEFEVQANLFVGLHAKGYKVRGELCWFDPELRIHCRFDLVIFDAIGPARILEVKAAPRTRTKTPLEDTRQGRRYRMFGVPVTFIYGSKEAAEFLESMPFV